MKINHVPLSAQSSLLDFDTVAVEDGWCDDGGPCETCEEELLIPNLRYPLYLIANDKGVLVVNKNGKDCVLLFHRKELAERHIAEANAIGTSLLLYPLAVPDADAFRQGLKSLPADITCAIWDATIVSHDFAHVGMNELYRAIDE
jgi:hypothetical protein